MSEQNDLKPEGEPKLEPGAGDNTRNVVKDDELSDAMTEAREEAMERKESLTSTRKLIFDLLYRQDPSVTIRNTILDLITAIDAELAKLDKVV